jgi:WD40 repeat protein
MAEPDFYHAFICHRRSDGAAAARWLSTQLKAYRLPRDLEQSLEGEAFLREDLEFSPDGRYLGMTGTEGVVKIWETGKWALVIDAKAQAGFVHSLSFSPDGRWVATGAEDTTVCIWDLSKRELATVLDGHSGAIRAVAFSPDGRYLAAGSDSGRSFSGECNRTRGGRYEHMKYPTPGTALGSRYPAHEVKYGLREAVSIHT